MPRARGPTRHDRTIPPFERAPPRSGPSERQRGRQRPSPIRGANDRISEWVFRRGNHRHPGGLRAVISIQKGCIRFSETVGRLRGQTFGAGRQPQDETAASPGPGHAGPTQSHQAVSRIIGVDWVNDVFADRQNVSNLRRGLRPQVVSCSNSFGAIRST